MGFTNEEVAKRFAEGDARGTSGNMFIEGDVVYSYGHHFPIAWRGARNGVVYVNEDSYSVTTARHKSYVLGWLNAKSARLEFVPTHALQSLIKGEPAIIKEMVQPDDFRHLRLVMADFFKRKGISAQRAHFETRKFLEKMKKYELLASI